MKGFKYVPTEFADNVSAGRLSIATARFYAGYDGPLVDRYDEARVASVAFFSSDSIAAPEVEAINRLGMMFAKEGGRIRLQNVSVIKPSPPDYFMCFSDIPDNQHLIAQGLDAVFEIEDLDRFAHRVRIAHLSQLHTPTISRVTYAAREFDVFAGPIPEPDPFIKRPAYAPEREIRVRWLSEVGEPRFITDAPRAGRLLRRIR